MPVCFFVFSMCLLNLGLDFLSSINVRRRMRSPERRYKMKVEKNWLNFLTLPSVMSCFVKWKTMVIEGDSEDGNISRW